ncbi:hypothetical protein HYALB_00000890 [Hymenoscyphus albidus]|uniref:valine--tRNA ligase n=1 Tax=Hymenoscyphus albidus TaxID=595503 RepID=A0A9N9LG05_9HELO|nr:hypothetical protein HYALB_00000890 [Hymenoscyphus albidus]
MSSQQPHISVKPISEKRRLKLEKFVKNKQKQRQTLQTQSGASTEKNSKKQDVAALDLKDCFWENRGLFKPQTETNGTLKPKGKYVIAIPPPNVTGKLHVGHALALSLEDTLIRWHRMRQFSTLYIPGCDHAGIATQAVVETQLAKHPRDGRSKRQDYSRAEFVQLCQNWKEDHHKAINKITHRLGVSVDWDREGFTMSPQLSKAVTQTFVQLHSEGLIYRANRLVHWSCRLSTALSTIEVDQKVLEGPTKLDVPGYDKKIEFGTLTFFKYPIQGSEEHIEVATTRPETMLGDTGIAAYPNDDRYKDFIGKIAQHPIVSDRQLKIVADDSVDRSFGTGAVKLTPAHDHNDSKLGKKHDLEFINILNEDGTLNANAGSYAGEKRFNARYRVIEELKRLHLYTKQEPNKMVVPICSRSGDFIEPLLKPQWWMRMEPLAKPAIAVVESGELVIRPDLQKRQYLQWMRNHQDWCLSRQLWWGHQIPAYHISIEGESGENDDNDDYWVCGKTQQEAQETAERKFPGKKVTIKQDEDVLDTWFSSALWPFSTLGWPDKTSDLENYFPNTTLETGWDILPFWVSRMIMFSLKLTGKASFTDVFCHGLIRDSDGRKMSKSLGNVIDPTGIIDGISLSDLHEKLLHGIPEIGADALRFSLINYTQSSGSDINFDIKTMQGYRKFCNKIYQVAKFVLGKLGKDFVPRRSGALAGRESLPERWILTKMNTAAKHINQALEDREFSRSTQIIHRYLYDELSHIFIENSKSILDGTPEETRSVKDTLYTTLESGLKQISPFMPFLGEELWQRLPRRPGDSTQSITIADCPEYDPSFDDAESELAYTLVLDCSRGIRSLLADYAIKDKGVSYIATSDQESFETVAAQLSAIEALSGKTPVKIVVMNAEETTPPDCAVFPISSHANVYLEVIDGAIDPTKEAERFNEKVDEAQEGRI